jgi:hypothetical protein
MRKGVTLTVLVCSSLGLDCTHFFGLSDCPTSKIRRMAPLTSLP